MSITTIDRDIAAGEKFTHDGSVVITGNILDGAEITIVNGGLLAKKNIGNNVALSVNKTPEPKKPGLFSFLFKKAAAPKPAADETIKGIMVEGTTGDNVRMTADGSIVLNDAAGDFLRLRSEEVGNALSVVKLTTTGLNPDIMSEGTLVAEKLGAYYYAFVWDTVEIGQGGIHGDLTSARDVRMGIIGDDSRIHVADAYLEDFNCAFPDADHDAKITGDAIGKNCEVIGLGLIQFASSGDNTTARAARIEIDNVGKNNTLHADWHGSVVAGTVGSKTDVRADKMIDVKNAHETVTFSSGTKKPTKSSKVRLITNVDPQSAAAVTGVSAAEAKAIDKKMHAHWNIKRKA